MWVGDVGGLGGSRMDNHRHAPDTHLARLTPLPPALLQSAAAKAANASHAQVCPPSRRQSRVQRNA